MTGLGIPRDTTNMPSSRRTHNLAKSRRHTRRAAAAARPALAHLVSASSEPCVVLLTQPFLHVASLVSLGRFISLHVRRRALLAFRALAEHDTALLHRISGDITKRLHDTYPMVLNAALAVAIAAVEVSFSL